MVGFVVGADEIAVDVDGVRGGVEFLPGACGGSGAVDIEAVLVVIGDAVPDEINAAVVGFGDEACGGVDRAGG